MAWNPLNGDMDTPKRTEAKSMTKIKSVLVLCMLKVVLGLAGGFGSMSFPWFRGVRGSPI